MITCERCGKEIEPHPHGRPKKYCSERCRKKAEVKRYLWNHPEKKWTYKHQKGPSLPGQNSAIGKVHYAVKKGEIVKPDHCQRCNVKRSLVAHHFRGYDHPYDIIWLCHRCHAYAHGQATSAPLDPTSIIELASRAHSVNALEEGGKGGGKCAVTNR